MTLEELEKQNAEAVVKHPPHAELEKAAQLHFDSVEFVDPPQDFMETTQAEAERLQAEE